MNYNPVVSKEYFIEGKTIFQQKVKEQGFILQNTLAVVLSVLFLIIYIAAASYNLKFELLFCVAFIQFPSIYIFMTLVRRKLIKSHFILKMHSKSLYFRIIIFLVLFYGWYNLEFNIYKPYLYASNEYPYQQGTNCQITKVIDIPNKSNITQDNVSENQEQNLQFIEKYSILEIQITHKVENQIKTLKGHSCISNMKHQILPSISKPAPYQYESLEYLTQEKYEVPLKMPSWKCLEFKEMDTQKVVQDYNQLYEEELQNCHFIPYIGLYTYFENEFQQFLDDQSNLEVIFERQSVAYYPKFQFYIQYFVFVVLQTIIGLPAVGLFLQSISKNQNSDYVQYVTTGEAYGTIRNIQGKIDFTSLKSLKLTAVDKHHITDCLSKVYKVQPNQFHFGRFECGGKQNQTAFQIQILSPQMRAWYNIHALKKRFNMKSKAEVDKFHYIGNDLIQNFWGDLIIKSQIQIKKEQIGLDIGYDNQNNISDDEMVSLQ